MMPVIDNAAADDLAGADADAPVQGATADRLPEAVDFGRTVAVALALLSVGAGMLHLTAAGDHRDHLHILAFFIAIGTFQLAWAARLAWRPSNRVLAAGLGVNAAVIAVWILSRTHGIPLIPEVGEREALGLKDAATSGLEVVLVAGAAMLVAMPAAAFAATLRRAHAERLVGAVGFGVLALAIPGMLAPHGHEHTGDDHAHGVESASAVSDDGHAHGATAEAAGASEDGHGHDAATATTDAGHSEGDGHSHDGTASAATAAATHVGATDAHSHDAAAAAATGEAGGDHAHGGDPAGGGDDHAAHGAAMADGPAPVQAVGKPARVLYGPFVLPPAALGGTAHRNLILPLVQKPCVNCYVTSIKPDLVYLGGKSANLDTGAMLHHAVFIDTTRNDATCGRNGVGILGERFFAAGNERTSGILPPGYGYRVGNGGWLGIFELMNHSNLPKVVFIQMDVTWVPASDPNTKPVRPLWLDIANCGNSEFEVPAGSSHTTWDWVSNVTGRIVTTAGHVHDGGVYLKLENASTGEQVCNSLAGYGTNPAFAGAIESMTSCSWDRVGRVRAGETLRLDALYNPQSPQHGVMGIMMAFLYETADVDGGSPSPWGIEVPPDDTAPNVATHAH
jgi:hypothetical protein